MSRPPKYREWAPPPTLARHVACTWTARVGDDGTPHTDRVLPDGCLDLVWDGAALTVAGPDTGPVPLSLRAGTAFVGLRFRPGAAPSALGVPASALRDLRVAAADVLGPRAAPLTTRLAAATPQAAREAMTAALRGWLVGSAAPDPLVAALVDVLRAARGRPVGVARLARDLGVSERQLRRRSTAAVGYGPTTLARVLRFRRFLDLALAPHAGLADLAAAAGYADQAHLTREAQRLAGRTPSALLAPAPPATAANASDPFKTGAPDGG